jgi:hypothetical protein
MVGMTEGAKKVLVCGGTSLSNTPSMSVPVVPEEQGEQNARARESFSDNLPEIHKNGAARAANC